MTSGGSQFEFGPGLLASWWDWLWFHNQTDSSTFARGVDNVFFYIFWVSTAFFVILMVLMAYFAVKYRRRPGVAPEYSASHNTPLEITWSVVPTILMAVMFVWGTYEYLPLKIAPADSEVIHVTARQWGWEWVYDNGAQSRDREHIADMDSPVFALPRGRPVKFIMSSNDVIHSMFIAAFRIKRDVFPNMYTSQWTIPTISTHRWSEELKKFVPIQPGANNGFYLACAEYCGDQHSQMWGRIMVLEDTDYQHWKAIQASTDDIPLLTLGESLHKTKGCVSCHSVDGSKGTGPTWKGIWGTTEHFKDGSSAVVDENFVRESILEPAKRILQGFSNQMTSFQGQITDRELMALNTFIKSLSANPDDVSAAKAASEAEMEARKKAAEEAPKP